MAWNEPGDNGKDNDPWGGGRKGGGDQGPPDIDEVIRNLSKKFGGWFGGSSGRSSGGSSGGGRVSLGLIAGVLAAVVAVWAVMGIYTVDESERGVVLRFGRVLDTIVEPGLHWNPPLIDEVNIVSFNRVSTKSYRNDMLTTDENILNIAMTVQYVITDPVDYVIAVTDPEGSLDHAAESAIRHAVGSNYMDQILTTGRGAMADDVQGRLQSYMDAYNTGIRVQTVNVTDAQPPEAVRPAFDDVIRAREDEQRAQNRAQQYANQVIPEARGEAQRTIEQANAYRQEVIAMAQGDASRFNQLLTEYSLAPEVTRERLYIDAMQDVMTRSSKIMVDVEGGNNMLYVPLDKILEQSGNTAVGRNAANASVQELEDLADRLSPYLAAPGSTSNTVDRTRLPDTGRGR
ncbi:MAG: FtsH protease activity modulator HflK [Pseudohongiellaceae bacterium]